MLRLVGDYVDTNAHCFVSIRSLRENKPIIVHKLIADRAFFFHSHNVP